MKINKGHVSKYIQALIKKACWFSLISNKIGICPQISCESHKIKIPRGNPFSVSFVFQCGRTDGEAVRLDEAGSR